jgi:hypothetical protein
MWHNRAHINSPDVIREFRNQMVRFDGGARQSIGGIQSDAQRVAQWLRYEQMGFWKLELRKATDQLQLAKSAYLIARDAASVYGKSSCVDEQRALRKAERRKEEAERKMQATKRWMAVLERETEKLMGPVNVFSSMLDTTTPRALAKLDQLVVFLEEYLHASPDQGTP